MFPPGWELGILEALVMENMSTAPTMALVIGNGHSLQFSPYILENGRDDNILILLLLHLLNNIAISHHS